MPRSIARSELADAIGRFESELRRLAWAIAAHAIITELSARAAPPLVAGARPARTVRGPASRRSKVDAARASGAASDAGVARPGRGELTADSPPLPAEPMAHSPSLMPTDVVADSAAATASATRPPTWTRESVTEALGRWLIAKEPVDASFVRRHGPRGLVSSAIRIFGRFDAALNAANLHVAEQLRQKAPQPSAPAEQLIPLAELTRRHARRRGAAKAAP